jgi:uncharacterized protein
VTADVDPRTHLQELDRDECVRMLRAKHLGRLGVVVGRQPLIFPVNYALDGENIVFRTDPGTKLHAAVGEAVAFEIDDADNVYHAGASVLVVGTAELVPEREHDRLHALPLGPWCPGRKATWVRIRPGAMTGRRIDPVEVAKDPTRH